MGCWTERREPPAAWRGGFLRGEGASELSAYIGADPSDTRPCVASVYRVYALTSTPFEPVIHRPQNRSRLAVLGDRTTWFRTRLATPLERQHQLRRLNLECMQPGPVITHALQPPRSCLPAPMPISVVHRWTPPTWMGRIVVARFCFLLRASGSGPPRQSRKISNRLPVSPLLFCICFF